MQPAKQHQERPVIQWNPPEGNKMSSACGRFHIHRVTDTYGSTAYRAFVDGKAKGTVCRDARAAMAICECEKAGEIKNDDGSGIPPKSDVGGEPLAGGGGIGVLAAQLLN